MNQLRDNNSSYPVQRRNLTDELLGSFGRLFEDFGAVNNGTQSGMDFYETEGEFVLELAVPGLSSRDIDIDVEGRQLTIRAELPKAESEGRRYWLRSMPRGAFSRNFRLPASVDTESIGAQVQAGLLTLTIPKAAEARTRRIEISDA